MGGNRDSMAPKAAAFPVSEDSVILIIVAMLTSMSVVLSGAPLLALNALAAFI